MRKQAALTLEQVATLVTQAGITPDLATATRRALAGRPIDGFTIAGMRDGLFRLIAVAEAALEGLGGIPPQRTENKEAGA
jgi:hypothetical protein